MIHSLLTAVHKVKALPEAHAHCDIPCKIYDPSTAQIAALSVIRLTDLLLEFGEKSTLTIADHAQISRLTSEKETHAEKVKHEIRIMWGDYFKAPQFEKYPDTNALVHNIMLAGSACKQHVSRDKGLALLTLVNTFAEYFWSTKGVATKTVTCPYPPALDVVYPDL